MGAALSAIIALRLCCARISDIGGKDDATGFQECPELGQATPS
jgi:hypothetical protein